MCKICVEWVEPAVMGELGISKLGSIMGGKSREERSAGETGTEAANEVDIIGADAGDHIEEEKRCPELMAGRDVSTLSRDWPENPDSLSTGEYAKKGVWGGESVRPAGLWGRGNDVFVVGVMDDGVAGRTIG